MEDIAVMATGVLSNQTQQYLFAQEVKNDLWGLTGGGIHPFELPEIAVPREVGEEAGIQVLVEGFICANFFRTTKGKPILQLAYSVIPAYPVNEPRVIWPHEIRDLRWQSLEETLEKKSELRSLGPNIVPIQLHIDRGYLDTDTIKSHVDYRPPMKIENVARVAVSAVIEKGNEFLYVQVTEKTHDQNNWGFVGGKYDPTKDPVTALKNIIREKTSLDVFVKGFIGGSFFESDKGNPVFNLVYLAKEAHPQTIRFSDKIMQAEYINLEQIRRLFYEGKLRGGYGNVEPVARYLLRKRKGLTPIYPSDTVRVLQD